MQIGIDFGTTHTTAAYFDGRQLHFLPLDKGNKEAHLLRSMLYVTKEHETLLGMEAVQTYLNDNVGRPAKFVQKYVGTIENTVSRISRRPMEPDGPITYIQDVYVEEDVSAPGRLIQSIKTGLRDADYSGTRIFDRFFTVQELVALILRRVRQQATAELGQPITTATLGRPVKFSQTEAVNTLAEQRLREAAELAGFTQVEFMQEPVAAALFYTLNMTTAKTVLVFDFGGGTLDLTVMQMGNHLSDNGRAGSGRFSGNGQTAVQILATEGVLVGGDDFDSAIMQGKVAAYFGADNSIDREGHPFPAHLTSKLYQWQTIPELAKATSMPVIRKARLYGDNPGGFAALECLTLKNYGFTLFEKIENSKRELSQVDNTQIIMQTEAINLDLPLNRKEFRTYIADEIAQVQLGIDEVLMKADLLADQIDVVVTTGGSSLIPIFQQILQRRFSLAELAHSDTFGSVAAGLAVRAQQVEA